MTTNQIFAERFKARRLELGFNQAYLSDKLNIQRSTITNYEKGYIMPTAANLPAIASVLNVSVDYLLGRTDYVNKEDMTNKIRQATKRGIHDVGILINDLKEQVSIDEQLSFNEILLNEKQKDLIVDQLNMILKIISQ